MCHKSHNKSRKYTFSIMAAVYKCFLFVVFVSNPLYVSSKKYNPVNTYFHRIHPNGTVVDQHNPATRLKFNFQSLQHSEHIDPKVFLKATPSIVANGGNVTLSWAGVKSPNAGDAVVFYCPADAKPSHYLDYYHVTSSPTWKQGFGDFQLLKVFNMRSECEFRYYWNPPNSSTIQLAKSNLISFEGGPNAPLQGHIALTGKPTEMRVMWVSGTNETPIVYYGQNSSLTEKAMGTTNTYTAADMCAPTANTTGFYDTGYIHDVLLAGLKPSTVYYYKYGSSEILSPVRQFKTSPLPGPEVAFKFIAYGDMGVQSPATGAYDIAKYVLREVKNGNATQVFHIGDISYAMGYSYIWDQWHALIEPYATLVPYMVGIGNHEQDHERGGKKDPSGAPGEGFHPWWGGYGTDSNGECGVPMYYRFHMPDNGNAVFWYSYNYGSVHFIMMSTEHDYMKGSRQHTWLENDLKNVDRSVTPWVIIGGHRPMYTSQAILIDYFVSQGMKHGFEDLLMKYKVDLALWAHYHSYERTCAVYKEECTEGAPTHIVVGTAGRSFDGEDYWPKIWSMYREINYGYGRVTVANSTALHWQWIRNKDDVVADEVWIYKKPKVVHDIKQVTV